MARVAGVDIPNDKRLEFSLPYIYGVGRPRAKEIAAKANLPLESRVGDLTEEELVRLRAIVEGDYVVEGDLRRDVRQNIQRLIEINCYRGYRHRRGLPVRGQRTKTNARTRRGSKRTVAGKRRVARKK
jgi:small subunit ribosomal protein S13